MTNSDLVVVHYDVTATDLVQLKQGAAEMGLTGSMRYMQDGLNLDTCDTGATAISVFVSSRVGRAEMEAMPNLKLIVCRSTGYDNVDLGAAQERDIVVCNVPSYGVETVAEYTVALALLLVRRLNLWADPGDGVGPADLCGLDISGKTIGVVGTGAIGRHFISLIKAFGTEVLAYDLYPNEQVSQELGFRYVPLKELLGQSHIVSLHAPATPETEQMINEDSLSQMRMGSFLINTARGELVDTEALLKALKSGHLAGAALDVFDGEELIWEEQVDDPRFEQIQWQQHQLRRLPQVIITPHNAFNTSEAIGRINDETLKVIEDWLAGDQRNVVRL